MTETNKICDLSLPDLLLPVLMMPYKQMCDKYNDLGIRPVWSVYSLCHLWVAKGLSFHHVELEAWENA